MTLQTPVLIIGAGPAGLCASILLSRHRVGSLLVERHPGTSIHPKATGVSVRTMELMRGWGVEPAIRAASLPVSAVASVAHTLGAPETARTPLAVVEPAHALSPADVAVCPQDHLEPILLEYARSFSQANVRFGAEVTSLVQDKDGVTATVQDRTTGELTSVRARYVIAADGAASPTRTRLNIRMVGVEHVNRYISVLFHADLSRHIRDRVAALYRIEHPAIKGVIVPTSTDGRWVFGMPWLGEDHPLETLGAERLVDFVRMAVGDPHVAVEIIGAQVFDIGAQVADRFREGDIFLAGDAAHRMTPSGALGMNSAIHDVHNLAWKMAGVLHGWANPSLLETYGAERRPVAERNVALSLGLRRDVGFAAADLGAVYSSSAVVPDGPVLASVMPDVAAPAWPGCRAPHVRLERRGAAISTVDLWNERFVLLCGDSAAGAIWSACGWGAARQLSIPFASFTIGRHGYLVDDRGAWHAAFGVEPDGAVLVRPDGHIAWRSVHAVANPIAEITEALARVLGRPVPVRADRDQPSNDTTRIAPATLLSEMPTGELATALASAVR